MNISLTRVEILEKSIIVKLRELNFWQRHTQKRHVLFKSAHTSIGRNIDDESLARPIRLKVYMNSHKRDRERESSASRRQRGERTNCAQQTINS